MKNSQEGDTFVCVYVCIKLCRVQSITAPDLLTVPIKLFTVSYMKRQIAFLTEYPEGKAFEYRMSYGTYFFAFLTQISIYSNYVNKILKKMALCIQFIVDDVSGRLNEKHARNYVKIKSILTLLCLLDKYKDEF